MKRRTAVLLLALLLIPCLGRRGLADAATERNRRAMEQFRRLVATKYIYKDHKQVHWNSLYAKHEYKILSSPTPDAFAKNLDELVVELKDTHFRVYDTSGNPIPRPRQNIVRNFDPGAVRKIVRNLEERNPVVSTGRVGQVGYLMIRNWAYAPPQAERILPPDLFADWFAGTRALIIDVRMNTGGYVQNAESFAARFTAHRLLAAYRHALDEESKLIKSPYYLEGEREAYSQPVIVLMGNVCASANEHFLLLMQAIPRVRTLGDRSSGSTGLPLNWRLSNGVIVSVPSKALMDLRNTYIEEYGVRPDERVPFTGNGSDSVLIHAFRKLGERPLAPDGTPLK